MYPASPNTGLDLAPYEVSPSSVCSRPSLPGSPAPSWILRTLSAKTSALCHVSWPHSTGHFLHGHVWPRCVHMCPYVCMCSMQLILLSHIAPSPLAINVPYILAMATICHFLETQGLPLQRAGGHRWSESALRNRM